MLRHYTRYDLPLDTDAASRFLPWIVGIMVFLAVLALAAFCVSSQVTERWRQSLSGGITIQIAAETGNTGDAPQAQRVEETSRLLNRISGVSVRAVSQENAQELLRPWLGEGVSLADLPVPALLEVTLAPGVSVDDIRLQLRGIPGVSVDDHQAWLADLMNIVRVVEGASLTIALLVTGITVLVVTFMARTGLAIHTAVIDLLHSMGATDKYIARQFQRHAFFLSLKGGASGWICAAFVVLAAGILQGRSEAMFLPSFLLSWQAWLALVCVPLAAVAISALTARTVVARALARLP